MKKSRTGKLDHKGGGTTNIRNVAVYQMTTHYNLEDSNLYQNPLITLTPVQY
jgi:hypothetical protein